MFSAVVEIEKNNMVVDSSSFQLLSSLSPDFESTSTRSTTPQSSSPRSTTPPLTNKPNNGSDLENTYRMATEVAVAAAIIVALAILLALIWNALKKRLPDVNNNNSSGQPSSSSRRRYSLDSLERLVEDRLRNRPPPFSLDQDKPPSYEDSFHDSTRRLSSPNQRRSSVEQYRRHQQQPASTIPSEGVTQNPREPQHQQSLRNENTSFVLPPYRPRNVASTVVIQSYDNPAFAVTESDESQMQESRNNEMPINSISMSIDSRKNSNDDTRNLEMEMVHL